MAYGRKRIMMLCLSCALLFFCGCVFCWGALHAPAAFFLLASLCYVPRFVACGFSLGAVVCALLHPKVSLCARLLFACMPRALPPPAAHTKAACSFYVRSPWPDAGRALPRFACCLR